MCSSASFLVPPITIRPSSSRRRNNEQEPQHFVVAVHTRMGLCFCIWMAKQSAEADALRFEDKNTKYDDIDTLSTTDPIGFMTSSGMPTTKFVCELFWRSNSISLPDFSEPAILFYYFTILRSNGGLYGFYIVFEDIGLNIYLFKRSNLSATPSNQRRTIFLCRLRLSMASTPFA
ncbi:hypothetical protein PM082_003613 [Marasmius tenuissimus]|nr:hypothetical protein PM082_003613 [Marasmius tenuissimus]